LQNIKYNGNIALYILIIFIWQIWQKKFAQPSIYFFKEGCKQREEQLTNFLNYKNKTNIMAEKTCTICGKKSGMSVTLVKLRGKYNPTNKVRKYPNLQWVKLPSRSGVSASQKTLATRGKRVLACAKCIKRMSKV